jgi:hypothetical protein
MKARALYRIRQIALPRKTGDRFIGPGWFHVERRIALFFWREVSACTSLDDAQLFVRADVRQRRLARIPPRLIGRFGADGKEIV